jgi:C4-dicarboxylate-specific signal transduction histidine kinase
MTFQPPAPLAGRFPVLPLVTALAVAVVFTADMLTPPDCIVGGLYIVVVLMAGQFWAGRRLWFVAIGCSILTVVAQVAAQQQVLVRAHAPNADEAFLVDLFNTTVTIVSIGLSCYLLQRGRAAQAALRRAQADLAHVGRVTTMGELAASIAHEVNQPIAGVVTNAGACLRWLAGETPDLVKAREAATRIVRDGTRASEIIGRIRQIFTKASPERRPVNLSLLAQETIGLLTNEASRYGVTMRTELVADVQPVSADRVQLQQVMVNLIVNAIEAMKDAPGRRELVVASERRRDGQMGFSVRDTGVGLSPEQADKMFDAFFTTKPQGTGMGLSISRSIIEAHGGRLSAEPNKGGGAVFTFSLPPAEAS